MKIVIAAPHYPPQHIGGTEQIAYRMAHLLRKKEHDVSVVCVESIDAEPGEAFYKKEEDNGVKVYRLFLQSNNDADLVKFAFRNESVLEWLMDFFEVEKPDIVHSLSGYLISGSVVEAAYEKHIAVVLTLLDYWFVCPRITLLRENGDLCPEPVPASRCTWCLLSSKRRFRVPDELLGGILGNTFTFLGKYQATERLMGIEKANRFIVDRRDYLKRMLEKTDVVISHSNFLQEKIRENNISTDNMVYLPNGIDFVEKIPPSLEKKTYPLKIGYIGQIAHHKGIHILIDAFLGLKGSPQEVELHVYGDGSRRPDYLASLVRKANHHPSIFFNGPYKAADVDKVIDNLDVVVVPSIWYENRPTVILEAFSRGKPVIASDLGGMAEMVSHDVDGLRFRAGDAQSLREQLQHVVDDPGILNRLSAGIQPVKAVDKEVDELEELYAAVIEKHQKQLV